MKKICTNKSDIYAIYGVIFFMISFFVYFAILATLLEKHSDWPIIVITTVFWITIPTFLTILFSEIHLKKHGKYIEVKDNSLVYNDELYIPFLLIKKIEYKKEKDQPKTLYFYMVNNNVEKFTFTKKVVKEIEQLIDIPIEYNLKVKKIPFKTKWHNFINKIKTFLKEYKIIIIFTILGLIITVVSFIIHANNKNNVLINVILGIICFAFGSVQFYYAYFVEKDYDKFTRKVMAVFASIVFIIIVALLILIGMAIVKVEVTAFVLLWALYLLPSFLIVVGIVILIIVGLSYA